MSRRFPSIHPSPVHGILALVLAGCTTSLKAVHFNSPPSAPTVGITPAAPVTTDTLTATIVADPVDAEGDTMTYHYQWLVDGKPVSKDTTLSPDASSVGQVVLLRMYADDGVYTGPTGEASVTIGDSAPAGSTATITPASPATGDDLVLALSATDADNDPITWGIVWMKDGVEVPDVANLTTIPSADTALGEQWTAVATPTDGTLAGPVASASVRVGDSAPTLTGLVLGPSGAKAGEALTVTCEGLYDSDGDSLNVHYTWSVGGVVVADDVAGATDTLSPAVTRGDAVSVSAYASDLQLDSAPGLSNTLTIADTAPTLASVLLSPDPAHETDTLTCTPGTAADVDGDAVTYTYGWQRNGSAVSYTTSTITGSAFARGDSMTCTVTPADDAATGTKVTSNAVSIENSPPSVASVAISPSPASAASTLSAVVSGWSDADGDAEQLTYSWVVDGVVVSTASTYTGVVRGQVVYVEVTPSDGYESGATVRSASVTVGDAAPTLASVAITPSVLYADSTPVAVPSGYADADGDSGTYRYQWYLDGTAAGGETTSALASVLVVGEEVQVSVWPSDGTSEGAAVSSSVITVSDRSPVAAAELLTAGTIQTCDEIQLSAAGSSDPDGTALTYDWTVHTRPSDSHRGTSYLDAASDELPYFIVDAAGTWDFRVAASDGSLSDSADVAVDVVDRGFNTTPVADAGPNESASEDAACYAYGYGIVCDACGGAAYTLDGSGSTDGDGDTLTYSWNMVDTSFVSISGTDTASPVVTVSPITPDYGVTTTVSATIALTVTDCAGGSSVDYVSITYACTGT